MKINEQKENRERVMVLCEILEAGKNSNLAFTHPLRHVRKDVGRDSK